jgi:molybdenum cofactor cytidylyltransferase
MIEARRTAAIVLAAGSSSRFGSTKALALLWGHPLLQHVLDAAAEPGFAEVVVVLGYNADEIERRLRWRSERRVRNPDPDAGLSSSLRVGLDSLSPTSEAALILLGDQPLVRAEVIEALLAGFVSANLPVIVPRYRGGGGPNPLLIHRVAWPLALEARADRGLGPVIRDHPDLIVEVNVEGSNPDIDTPEDLAALETTRNQRRGGRAARGHELNETPTILARRVGSDARDALASMQDTPDSVVNGRVEAVNRSGILVCLGNGALITLVSEATPLHPWAVAAPVPRSSLTRGDIVRAGDGMLCVGPLTIDLAAAEITSLELRRSLAPAQLSAATERLRSELCGIEPPASVASACYRFATTGDVAELDRIIGLGPGLTPSGDDVLMGLLAGLELTADAVPRSCILRAAVLRCLGADLEQRTTKLSAQLLRAAAAGRYAEPVLKFALALADCGEMPEPNEENAVTCATRTLLAMGHESGRSALAGVVLGVAPRLVSSEWLAPRRQS